MGRRNCVPLLVLVLLLTTLLTGSLPIAKTSGISLLYISPTVIDTQPAGTIITYQVKVANIDPFNAWDISVQTDPTVINATSLTITGNILVANYSATLFEAVNCVNGAGNNCIAGDGPGIVHSAVVSFGPPPQTGPSSGLLFTITYKVVGGLASSVRLFNDVIVNGGNAVSHTDQNGRYGNKLPPVVAFTWSPLSPLAGDLVTFDASLSYDPNSGASIVNYTWDFSNGLAPPPTKNQTIVHRFVENNGSPLAGNFTVTLTLVDSLGISNGVTHKVSVRPVIHFDFSMYLNVYSMNEISAGSTLKVPIGIVGSGPVNFPGTVRLTSSITPAVGNPPLTFFDPENVTVVANGGGSSILTVQTKASTTPEVYKIEVNGTAGSVIRSQVFSVTVVPFSVESTQSFLVLHDGQSGRSIITVTSINGFSGTLRLLTNVNCIGCTTSLTRDTINLVRNQTQTIVLNVTVASHTPYGSYLINVSAETSTLPFLGLHNLIGLYVPLLEPVFVRQGMSWTHHLSLVASLYTQTWTAQVSNPNGGDTIVLSVHINVTSSQGTFLFSVETGPIQLQPGETVRNITLMHVFSVSDVGLSFNFTATIRWGLYYRERGNFSSSTSSGSFTIAA